MTNPFRHIVLTLWALTRRTWWVFFPLVIPFPIASAQPIPFGAADDPKEHLQSVWWKHESNLYAMGGVSLIGAQWRGVANLSLDLVTPSLTAHLSGTVRSGYFGRYEADLDEYYDLVRLVEFARFDLPPRIPAHLRFGLQDRMRLGTGHLVSFFNSFVSWDERTVGVEGILHEELGEIALFTDNVLLNGVTGARAAIQPLHRTAPLQLQSLRLGFNFITDLAYRPPGQRRLDGYNFDVQFNLFNSGSIDFAPYASYAWYSGYGSSLGFGADLKSDLFIDIMKFRLRVGLFYNGKQFIPSYIGAFYKVNNGSARILHSNSNLDDSTAIQLAGITLPEARGGNDLLTELQILIFERFEFWYSFRRHFGVQRLSELNLRIFLRAADRLRLEVGIDRGGLAGFFTMFEDLNDLSHLVFGLDSKLAGPIWLYVRARYSYERLDEATAPTQLYLVQRRFEPMLGFRFTF